MQEPAIGADVTALMPDVGEDVTDLMGGTAANAAASPTASGEANARRGIVATPRSGESDTDYAMRVGEETWGTPTLPGLNVVGRVDPAARGVVNLAKRLYTSVLKPKDTTLQRFPNVVDDLLNQRRVISQGSRANVVRGMEQTGAEKRAILSAADQAGRTIPRESLRAGLDDALDDAIKTSEAPVRDLGKLSKLERNLLPDESTLSTTRTDAIKSRLQSEGDRMYRQMRMGGRVTETGAKARMAVAGRAKTALEEATEGFGRGGGNIRPTNEAYASLKGQSAALRDALKREGNTHMVGMRDFIGLGGGAALAGPEGAIAGEILMRLLTHPRTGSMSAIAANELARNNKPDQLLLALSRMMASHQQGQEP